MRATHYYYYDYWLLLASPPPPPAALPCSARRGRGEEQQQQLTFIIIIITWQVNRQPTRENTFSGGGTRHQLRRLTRCVTLTESVRERYWCVCSLIGNNSWRSLVSDDHENSSSIGWLVGKVANGLPLRAHYFTKTHTHTLYHHHLP